MKVYEGIILTVDKNDNVAHYLAEDEGKIIYVGDELPEKYKMTALTAIPEGEDTQLQRAVQVLQDEIG